MFGNMMGGSEGMGAHVTEIIEKLKQEVGLTEDQAGKVMEVIKNHVVEKFPMLQGAVNNMFGGSNMNQ